VIEWLSPWWLLVLLTLPLVWWLHRRPATDTAIPVSSLLLWQNSKSQGAATIRLNETDPLWWLRALIVTLLMIAAATPTWLREQGHRIEVWFDDSISMQAQETEGTRTALATDALLDKLAREKPATVILHSLTQPNHQLVLRPENRHQWHSSIDHWLHTKRLAIRFPEPGQMSTHAQHWLVSDGADPGFQVWLETAPISQLIQVGQVRENSAIIGLSLRTSLDNSRLDSIAVISHQGLETTNRQLTISANGQLLQQWPITLTAGQRIQKSFSIPHKNNIELSAALTPGDALTSDDRLKLTPQQLTPLSYLVLGECDRRLMIALSSHPMLSATSIQKQAAFTIVCDDKLNQINTATLWFYRNDQTSAVNGIPSWNEPGNELNRIMFTKQDLHHFASQTNTNKRARTILSAGNDVLIELQEIPQRLVKVSLDIDSPALDGTIDYPLLILGLINLTLARNLIDEINTAQHSVIESDIAPRRLTIRQPYTSPEPVGKMIHLAPWLIGLAILLLTCDVYVILLRRFRSGSNVEAPAHA